MISLSLSFVFWKRGLRPFAFPTSKTVVKTKSNYVKQLVNHEHLHTIFVTYPNMFKNPHKISYIRLMYNNMQTYS